MQRAMQQYLGLPGTQRPQLDSDLLPVSTVEFQSRAKRQLARQLEVLGAWQGGVLFGLLEEGRFTVAVTAPLAPPGLPRPLLMPSASYLLGWSEAVAAMNGEATDWRGNWVAAPDSQMPDERADLTWLTLGAQQGLFDEQHVLVVLGIQEGVLIGRAYRWEEGQPVAVDCLLGNRPPL